MPKGHPYGVLPEGNSFFCDQQELLVRAYGLGGLRSMKDEALEEILSFLPSVDLAAVSLTSRAMYVFAHHSDLWRDLTLRAWPGRPINYVRSWKETYMRARGRSCEDNAVGEERTLHMPICVRGIFSNMLYRTWSCFSSDLSTACPGFFTFCDIDKVDSSFLDSEKFVEQYEAKNIPVVIKNAVNDWHALKRWDSDYLASVSCGESDNDGKKELLFRATSATAPMAANFTLAGYFKYARQACEEAPLYLFERDFALKLPTLENDYNVPIYFRDTATTVTTATTVGAKRTDLFSVLGQESRPDFRWLICGPKRSGSIFHIDPNQTNAWNVSVQGRKKWIFYPPKANPPGVVSSDDGADVTVPICTGEWLLSFWTQHLEMRKAKDRSLRPLEVIVDAGDVIFVPHGYWHMVVNLDDCIALTHNYVSTSNLKDCLRFLREKPDQISGVRDRPQQAFQPEELYEVFVGKLEDQVDPRVLERALRDREGGVERRDTMHQREKQQEQRYQAASGVIKRRKKGGNKDKDKEEDESVASFSFSFF